MDDKRKHRSAAVLGRRGGRARAEKLPPERRAEIASKASRARWEGHQKTMKALSDGEIELGDFRLSCAVLEDGRRVISERAFLRSLGRGRPSGQAYRLRGGDHLPIYLAPRNLKQFIPNDFSVAIIPYRQTQGGVAHGVQAEAIPTICRIWDEARRAGKLRDSQLPTAERAAIMLAGLAHVGIVALVDEATGFQYERSRRALAEILERFIAKELARWAKTFEEDYYEELFRLRGLDYCEFSSQRPPIIGRLTSDIVYRRLAPGVLEELRRKNPKTEKGYRRARHHQGLTPGYGHPKLREHLAVVVALMKVSDSYESFELKLDRVAPRFWHTLPLPWTDG